MECQHMEKAHILKIFGKLLFLGIRYSLIPSCWWYWVISSCIALLYCCWSLLFVGWLGVSVLLVVVFASLLVTDLEGILIAEYLQVCISSEIVSVFSRSQLVWVYGLTPLSFIWDGKGVWIFQCFLWVRGSGLEFLYLLENFLCFFCNDLVLLRLLGKLYRAKY